MSFLRALGLVVQIGLVAGALMVTVIGGIIGSDMFWYGLVALPVLALATGLTRPGTKRSVWRHE